MKRMAVFRQVEEPEPLLKDLLDIYWQGLKKALPFFPRSSYAYARTVPDRRDERGLRAAARVWTGSGYQQGECENGAYRILFADTQVFDAEFTGLARRVYDPLLTHLKEENL
jgi:exodeoxyribonuclease V gamma subunit